MRKPVVDLNQSMEFTPSTPSPEVHNFMPMTPFALPYQQETKDDHEVRLFSEEFHACLVNQNLIKFSMPKDEEDPRHSRLMEMQRNSLEMFWNQQIFEIHNTSGSISVNHIRNLLLFNFLLPVYCGFF